MKITKLARREAKQLFKSCLVDGRLSADRVRQAVNLVIAEKPRGYLAILAHFQRLVRLEVERRTARVESSVTLTGDMRGRLQGSLGRLYGEGLEVEFAENTELLGGVRIQVGSDVYDGSVRTRLRNLEAELTR